MVGVCAGKTVQLYRSRQAGEAEKAAILAEIEAEDEKRLDAKTRRIYTQSDEYKEKEARNRFNLIQAGDYLIHLIFK